MSPHEYSWSYRHGRHIPIVTRWANIGPPGGYVCGLLGIQTGKEDLSISPRNLFHRAVRVVWPLTRRGTQAVRISRHHRLVLGLGYLVFTEVKAFGQGDIVLVLASDCLPASVVGLPIVKVPGSTQSISRFTLELRSTVCPVYLKATRKPMSEPLGFDPGFPRLADRKRLSRLQAEPPRGTLKEPVDGPCGSVACTLV